MTPELLEIIDYIFTKIHDVILEPVMTIIITIMVAKFFGFLIKLMTKG